MDWLSLACAATGLHHDHDDGRHHRHDDGHQDDDDGRHHRHDDGRQDDDDDDHHCFSIAESGSLTRQSTTCYSGFAPPPCLRQPLGFLPNASFLVTSYFFVYHY